MEEQAPVPDSAPDREAAEPAFAPGLLARAQHADQQLGDPRRARLLNST